MIETVDGNVIKTTSAIQPPRRFLWSYRFFLDFFIFFDWELSCRINGSLDDRLMSDVREILRGITFA